MTDESGTKPCTVPGCPGTMVYSLRVVPVRVPGREVVHPRPGWLCNVDRDHIAWPRWQ